MSTVRMAAFTVALVLFGARLADRLPDGTEPAFAAVAFGLIGGGWATWFVERRRT